MVFCLFISLLQTEHLIHQAIYDLNVDPLGTAMLDFDHHDEITKEENYYYFHKEICILTTTKKFTIAAERRV